jgi:hypothetical protein
MASFKDCGKVPDTDTIKIEILVRYAIWFDLRLVGLSDVLPWTHIFSCRL